MGVESLFAVLSGEPFLLRLDEIANLTDWQIEKIYGHPRNKKTGAVDPDAVAKVPARLTKEQRRAQFFAMGAGLGIPEEELKRKWEEKHGRE